MRKISDIRMKAQKFRLQLRNKNIVENFGNREMQKLEDYIGCVYDYSYEDRLKINSITEDFFNWCINYSL